MNKNANMAKDKLEEIGKRVGASTPGPWEIHEKDNFPLEVQAICKMGRYYIMTTDEGVYVDMYGDGLDADAEFIAHAREDIPRLLAYIKHLEDEIRIGLGG
jgi:hypothetical protein